MRPAVRGWMLAAVVPAVAAALDARPEMLAEAHRVYVNNRLADLEWEIPNAVHQLQRLLDERRHLLEEVERG